MLTPLSVSDKLTAENIKVEIINNKKYQYGLINKEYRGIESNGL